MRCKAVTETGSYYHIDFDSTRWAKNSGPVHRLSFFAVNDYEFREDSPFTEGSLWKESSAPVVGKVMYVSQGLHKYWVTTEVVEVNENPEDWEAVMGSD